MSIGGNNHKLAGFTLIELIAVLLVVSILTVFVSTRVVDTRADLTAEADIMRANLRFVQGLALSANTAVWSVLVGTESYQLMRDGEQAPLGFPDGYGAVRQLNSGVQVVGGDGTLVFDSMGAPSEDYTITISDGTQTETVTVTGFTGFIP